MRRHVAQLNIATLRHPLDDPRTKDFVDALPIVNGLGEESSGYVWRLQSESGNATDVRMFDDPAIIVNLTVWESLEALRGFAYRGTHRDFFRRRDEWFVAGASRTALWWIPAGTLPTTDDAKRRLEFIAAFGPSPYAFEMGRAQPALVMHHVALADGALVVAELDDAPAATAAYRRTDDGCAEVDRIYVAGTARGLRIGAALVAELEAAARREGMRALRLETRNPALCSLYEAFGFSRSPGVAGSNANQLHKSLEVETVR